MEILVIGGTGFLGRHVVAALCRRGHAPTVYHRGRKEADLPGSVRHLHRDSDSALEEFPPDAALNRWDAVVHLFAMTERQASAFRRAFRGAARRAVVISSADVYRAYGVLTGKEAGPPERMPLSEDAALRERLYPYRGAAGRPDPFLDEYEKILVEREVSGDPALPVAILRLPALYGPADGQRRFFPWWKRMADGRPAILLGERQACWRWTHGYVEDVADAIALAALSQRASGNVYNVGESPTPTTAERVAEIARVAEWNGRVVPLTEDALPPPLRIPGRFEQDMVLETSRIRRELGYAETVSREEGLRRTIAWERANPPETIPSEQFDYEAEDRALRGGAASA